jgi:hypothetical protein
VFRAEQQLQLSSALNTVGQEAARQRGIAAEQARTAAQQAETAQRLAALEERLAAERELQKTAARYYLAAQAAPRTDTAGPRPGQG